MEQVLTYDQILPIVPHFSKVNYTRPLIAGERLEGKDVGLEQLFGSVINQILSQFPLTLEAGWGNYEYGEAGIFYTSIHENIRSRNNSFPSRFWREFKTTRILRINVHCDGSTGKLHVSFWHQKDYEVVRETIKDFVATHPEFRIRTLLMYVHGEGETRNEIIKFEKIAFIDHPY